MADLDPQVQIKLIETSEKWVVKAEEGRVDQFKIKEVYPKTFDTIYKQLAKTVSEAMSGK